ncbi:copper-binding transcription factor [Ascosphaera acerosa]|nr:copper-binding transcription factor [Ascosphaera acerosa]
MSYMPGDLPNERGSAYGAETDVYDQSFGNLDFDARVPIPFSVFPSSYKSDASAGASHQATPHHQEDPSQFAGAPSAGREDTGVESSVPDLPAQSSPEPVETDLTPQPVPAPPQDPSPAPDSPEVQAFEQAKQQAFHEEHRPSVEPFVPYVNQPRIAEEFKPYAERPRVEYDPALSKPASPLPDRQAISNQLDVTERDFRRRTHNTREATPEQKTSLALIPKRQTIRPSDAQSQGQTGLIPANTRIESHVLLPLLRRKELAPFHPLIRSLAPRIQAGEIATLRDLERTLLGLSVNFAISKAVGRNVYAAFAHYTIQCLHATVPALCDRELKADHERAYSGLYFLDLVEQVRQYAAVVGRARMQRAAAVAKTVEQELHQGGFDADDELVLVNELSGQPAELVRRKKDGRMYYLSSGKPYEKKALAAATTTTTTTTPPRNDAASHSSKAVRAPARRPTSTQPGFVQAIELRLQRQAHALLNQPTKLPASLNPTCIAGVKRAIDATLPLPLSADEPPTDVSRSMARRKKGEAPMDINALCQYCRKRFRRPCDLTKHMKTHTRPYKCPEPACKYFTVGWPTEKERDRHVNDKHSKNPRLYHCEFGCGYQSKRESNCKQHMEKTHNYTYERMKRCSTSAAGRKNSAVPAAAAAAAAAAGTTTPDVKPDDASARSPTATVPAFDFSALPTPSRSSCSGTSVSGDSTVTATDRTTESAYSGVSTPNTAISMSPGNGSVGMHWPSHASYSSSSEPVAQGAQAAATLIGNDAKSATPTVTSSYGNEAVQAAAAAGQSMLTDGQTNTLPLQGDIFAALASNEAAGVAPDYAGLAIDCNALLADMADPSLDLLSFSSVENALALGLGLGGGGGGGSNGGGDYAMAAQAPTGGVGAGTPAAPPLVAGLLQPQLYVDNMDVDVTDLQQDFAFFYQTLQVDPLGASAALATLPVQSEGNADAAAFVLAQQEQADAPASGGDSSLLQTPPRVAYTLDNTGRAPAPASSSSPSAQSDRSDSLSPPSLGGSPASMASTMSYSHMAEALPRPDHAAADAGLSHPSFVKGIFAKYDPLNQQAGGASLAATADEATRGLGSSSGMQTGPQDGQPLLQSDVSQVSFNDEEFITYSAAASQGQSFVGPDGFQTSAFPLFGSACMQDS